MVIDNRVESREPTKSEKLKKTRRINKEVKRLKDIYVDISPNMIATLDGLIYRAAWMRIQLEEYEKDLNEHGYIEMFTQSNKTAPYERERPAARLYNSTNGNYQKLIKQLSDLLPKGQVKPKTEDEFMDFITR